MSPSEKPRFRRVMLKLSGEMLKGPDSFGLNRQAVLQIAGEIRDAANLGIQVGVVIGGGNIFRGNSDVARDMVRAVADHIGMIATIINSLMLQEALEQMGVPTRVMTAIPVQSVAEPYLRRKAITHLEKGLVVIFGAGTGNPYFTTDSAAALRAAEVGAEVVLKGTKVDGVYTADPRKDPTAVRLEQLTFTRAIDERLNVMDTAAISICQENKVPIIVYDLSQPGNTRRVLTTEGFGTLISGD